MLSGRTWRRPWRKGGRRGVNKLRFSGYGLKYWAMVLMLCDHTASFVIRRGIYAAFLTPEGYLDFSAAPAWLSGVSCLYQVLDVLGHAAFPLFVFLLSEGFLHTRSRKRYLLTLLTAALLSEPVYDWAHYGVLWSWRLQNVLFTLTVSCGLLWCLSEIEGRTRGRRCVLYQIIAIAAAGALAYLVRGEYVFLGTTAAALFYLLREKGRWRLAGLLPLTVASPWVLLAAPLLLLYSGERGTRGRKYFFYVFYPAHFPVLVWIGGFLQKIL